MLQNYIFHTLFISLHNRSSKVLPGYFINQEFCVCFLFSPPTITFLRSGTCQGDANINNSKSGAFCYRLLGAGGWSVQKSLPGIDHQSGQSGGGRMTPCQTVFMFMRDRHWKIHSYVKHIRLRQGEKKQLLILRHAPWRRTCMDGGRYLGGIYECVCARASTIPPFLSRYQLLTEPANISALLGQHFEAVISYH